MSFSTHEHFDNAAIAIAHIDVRPLAAAMGAEVAGVDCANVGDAAFAEIEAALFRHEMIFFRGQQRMPPALGSRDGRHVRQPAVLPSRVQRLRRPSTRAALDGHRRAAGLGLTEQSLA